MTIAHTTLPRWEHFDQQAHRGVRGVGHTLNEAFEQAALAMIAVITEPTRIDPELPVEIECTAEDDKLLLVEWLKALILEMAARKLLFSDFTVHIDKHRLRATAWGAAMEIGKHKPAVEIKGVSHSALHVGRNDHGEWVAQTVVDV